MNTDNMLLCGETIDYGPCAFMEAYDPATVFSSIDMQGRYAYGNQPGIAHWNLARLAEALLPLIDSDSERAIEAAKGVLATFPARFGDAHSAGIAAKLGLARLADDADRELAEALFTALKADGADFTLAFRFLADEAQRDGAGSGAGALLDPGAALLEWLPRWKQRLEREDSTADERQRRMFASSPRSSRATTRYSIASRRQRTATSRRFIASSSAWRGPSTGRHRIATWHARPRSASACTGLSVAREPRRLRNGSRSAVRHRGRRALSKRHGRPV
jgi:uncharacterized protein YdiU (UPF0061 family)